MPSIERFAELIPASIRQISGKVFYSGRAAFGAPSSLYILGVHPGGSPDSMPHETVESHTRQVLEEFPDMWSAYCDESWRECPPGACGLQPRVLHLTRTLGLDARRVPSSNLVFVRSAREAGLKGKLASLAKECWPFHEAVINHLGVRVVLCLGATAGRWVSRQLNSNQVLGAFVEENGRRWRTFATRSSSGLSVITATHPSIADWTAPATDPTPFIRGILQHAQ